MDILCFNCNKKVLNSTDFIPMCDICTNQDKKLDTLIKKNSKELKKFDGIKKGEIDQITNTIFLGNKAVAYNLNQLKENSITHILICGRNIDKKFEGEFIYKTISIDDSLDEDIKKYFKETFTFIDCVKMGRILVHCEMGISRSSSIVISYLMRKFKKSLSEAYFLVKEKRPCIEPNENFMKQLAAYEDELNNDS